MTATVEYRNRLEQAFSRLPGVVQDALRPAYHPVDDALQWVCGDPDELLRAGAHYVSLGDSVRRTATAVQHDSAALEAHWSDDAGAAFRSRMDNTATALSASGEALSETEKILTAGARAAADAANTICDIVISVVEFIVADFVVAGALAVFTAGASVAAGVATAVAEWAEGVAQVARIVDEIAQVLRRIAAFLQELRETLAALREVFWALHKLGKEADLTGKMVLAGAKFPISKATSLAWNSLPGVPNLPAGGVHWGTRTVRDGHDVVSDLGAADRAGKG